MVEIQVAYEGQLRCRALHVQSGSVLQTDAPLDNHGRGERFSPTDLVAAGLGSCVLTIMGILAERHQINLEGAVVRVTKEMTSVPVRRIARLVVNVRVPGAVSEENRKRLENGADACPVKRSLHPDVRVEMLWQWGA